MAFEGTLATLPFVDLVQLLGSTRKTGTLHLTIGPYWKKLCLRDGVVILTSSNDPDEHISRTLVALGKVREEDLSQAVEEGKRDSKLIGLVLVEKGLVSPEVLRRYLADKAYEMVGKLMTWTEARFRFEEFELPAESALPLDLSAEALLMEGFRRSDELSRYKELLPSDDLLLERTGDLAGEELMDQTVVGLVLSKLDEPRSVRQLKHELKASDFTLLDGIAKLIEKGVLRQREQPPTPPPDPNWLPDARKLVMAGLYDPAIEQLRAGLLHEPTNDGARTLLARAESLFEREVTRRDLPLAAVPELVTSLESLQSHRLHPAEAFLLTRINGEVAIAELVDGTPLSAAETLRALQRLLKEGHIRLLRVRGNS